MQNFVITSGEFSASGNFSGYSKKALGFGDHSGRLFIHKRQMDAKGWKKGDDIQFPFIVAASEREYNKLDENGNPTEEKFKRLTSFAIYKNQEELNAAEILEQTVDTNVKIAVAQAVKASATAAGLTDEAINALQSVA